MLRNRIEIEDVHRIKRPGLGYVYRGRITAGDLYAGLQDGLIKYSPKYQRGYRPSLGLDPDPHELVPITDEKLAIETWRAQAMAAKYLMALSGEGAKRLFNPDVIWNARKDPNRPDPQYDSDSRHLDIFTILTIPDSGHRHFMYWLLGTWKHDPARIPGVVELDKNGETIGGEKIAQWIKEFDPFDVEESSVLVEVFNLPADLEGQLFDEYNDEGKPASTARAIDLYMEKTPSRRFVARLMEDCPIFNRTEIETATNTIGSKSRKLTTNATLEGAIRPFTKRLIQLEQAERDGKSQGYGDLISFFCAFYHEWANSFPEYLPSASYESRQTLRRRSFALQNITFFPMFRLAFELWDKYYSEGVDWRAENEWREALARLAGQTEVEVSDPTAPGKIKKIKVDVMARDAEDPPTTGNPEWRELVLVPKHDRQGNLKRWTLSNTRNTREAAFDYLCKIAAVEVPSRRKGGA